MNEIPMWWLILSALFFAAVTVFFAVMCVIMLQLLKVLKGIQPQITALSGQVQALLTQVRALVVKVDELSDKAGGIADGVRGTVDIVQVRTRSISDMVETLSAPLLGGLAKAAPIIGPAVTAFKLLEFFLSRRKKKPAKALAAGNGDKVSS